jgi:pilus assembly protein CpaC
VLTGSVRTPQDAAQAASLADIFLTGGEATTRVTTATSEGGDAAINAEARQKSKIVNLLKIDGEDQVTLKVTIAEVSRQVLKQLGFNTTITGTLGTIWQFEPGHLGTLSHRSCYARLAKHHLRGQDFSYISAMEQAGVMRTLAEPSLTAISGESARFYVGGSFQLRNEVDYDDNGRATYTDREVEYGIRLNFTPVVLSPGRISLKVLTEVSEPSFEDSTSLQGGQRPRPDLSIKRREAETAVELPSGGSMVLAGLVQDSIRQAMSGYPGLSKVPVFGTLFRSRDFMSATRPNWSSLPRLTSSSPLPAAKSLVRMTTSMRPATARASFSDGSTGSMARWKPNCRPAGITALSASFTSDQEPYHVEQEHCSRQS